MSNYIKTLLVVIILISTTIINAGTDGTVRGKVIDSSGQPMAGAQVFIAELNIGAMADENGNYIILNIPVGSYDLTCNVIGYAIQNIEDVDVINLDYPYKRITGIEILVRVEYSNMNRETGFKEPTAIITPIANTGWAGKGSDIRYLKYHTKGNGTEFVDRYRYGIKFKFIITGLMGEWNINSLINHLVSGIVLMNLSTVIVAFIATHSMCNHSDRFDKHRTKTISLTDTDDNVNINDSSSNRMSDWSSTIDVNELQNIHNSYGHTNNISDHKSVGNRIRRRNSNRLESLV